MTIRELINSSKKMGVSLSNVIFEYLHYIDDKTKDALLQELASLFDDEKEEDLKG